MKRGRCEFEGKEADAQAAERFNIHPDQFRKTPPAQIELPPAKRVAQIAPRRPSPMAILALLAMSGVLTERGK